MISQAVLCELTIDYLPQQLHAVAGEIGIPAAVALSEKYPGAIVRLPRSLALRIAQRYIALHLDTETPVLSALLGLTEATVERVRQRVRETREVVEDEFGAREMIAIGTIAKLVADQFGISLEDMGSSSRVRTVALPRQIAMYLTRRTLVALPLASIAEAFGRADHTTVLNACRVVQDRLQIDSAFRTTIETLLTTILQVATNATTNVPPNQ